MPPYVFSQPVGWVFRHGDDPNASADKHSPYYANSYVSMDDTKTACIQGFSFHGATIEHLNALMAELLRIGAKHVMYTRVKHGVPVTRTVPVKVRR
jgi:hypothetical protein